jgi:hypothetical protein
MKEEVKRLISLLGVRRNVQWLLVWTCRGHYNRAGGSPDKDFRWVTTHQGPKLPAVYWAGCSKSLNGSERERKSAYTGG